MKPSTIDSQETRRVTPIRSLLLLEEGYPTRYWEGALSALADSGVDVTFGTIRERQELHSFAEQLGFASFALGARNTTSYPRTVAKLTSIIRSGHFDALHLSEAIQGALGGVAAKFAKRDRAIFHRHHVSIGGSHKRYTQVAARSTRVTMAISEAVAAQAVLEGLQRDKVRVVHNGVAAPRTVDPEEIERTKVQLGVVDGDRVILVVGILREEKGQHVLLAALPDIVAATTERVHLVIVGAEPDVVRDPSLPEGKYMTRLRRGAASVEGAKAHFTGFQRDIAPWMEIADVVAMPSFRDAFGLVAIEAMAASKPVVASRVEGLAEVITDDVDGVLVPHGDANRLAGAITGLLNNKDIANRLAAAGHHTFMTRFTLEKMVDGWIDRYRELI